MDHLFAPFFLGMSLFELTALVFSAGSVLMAVKRTTWQYPIGIIGTILYFFVFQHIKLYASMGLQVFFTAVQIYGWWYWTRGDNGKAPKVTSWDAKWIGLLCAVSLMLAVCISIVLTETTSAKLALPDSAIFALSVVAQFLLDRKKLESWIIWAAVNVLSIVVYGSQGLTATAWLYGAFLLNTVWGYYEWNKAKKADAELDAIDIPIHGVEVVKGIK